MRRKYQNKNTPPLTVPSIINEDKKKKKTPTQQQTNHKGKEDMHVYVRFTAAAMLCCASDVFTLII